MDENHGESASRIWCRKINMTCSLIKLDVKCQTNYVALASYDPFLRSFQSIKVFYKIIYCVFMEFIVASIGKLFLGRGRALFVIMCQMCTKL